MSWWTIKSFQKICLYWNIEFYDFMIASINHWKYFIYKNEIIGEFDFTNFLPEICHNSRGGK